MFYYMLWITGALQWKLPVFRLVSGAWTLLRRQNINQRDDRIAMEREAVMKGCDVPCKGIAGDCSHCLIVPEPEHRRHDKRRFTGLCIEWGVLRLMCVFQFCTKKKQLWVNSHESFIQWTSTTFWFSTAKSMKTRGAGVSSPTGDHFYNPCLSSCKQLWYLLISFISGYDIPDTAVVSHLLSGLSHTFYLNWQKDTKANVEPHNLQTPRFILQVAETLLSNQHFFSLCFLGFAQTCR